jgi:hypothetical protein
MSWTRLHTDSCNYKQNLSENVSHLSYTLDPLKYEHCSKCFHTLGTVGATAVGVPNGNMVDIENDLFGINRPGSLCPSYKYSPSKDGYIQGKEYIKPTCHPRTDTTMKQLPSCQMFNLPSTPAPPPIDYSRCSS